MTDEDSGMPKPGKGSKTIEGPAGYGPHGGPDGAEKLPTKIYPDSSKIPYGKKSTIEGPCDGKEGYKK